MFDYQIALVRDISCQFINAEMLVQPRYPIDLELASKQHKVYVDTLRKFLPKVEVLSASDRHPDCCFIEDCAEVIGDVAIINRMGAASRRGEEKAVLEAFAPLNLKTHVLKAPAFLDGGDVLQAGDTIFIGLTCRSNQEAVATLQRLLPSKHVIPIIIDKGLHLKSFITQLDERFLVVSDCAQGRKISAQIEAKAKSYFQFIYVPDEVAANVVRIYDTVLIQASFEKSRYILEQACSELSLTPYPVCMDEMIKADGALTCCSILIH